MPKLKWRTGTSPYMNDPKFTADIEWQDNQGGPPTTSTPGDVVVAPVDSREHVEAKMGKGLEGQTE